jgi:hypothetical protein
LSDSLRIFIGYEPRQPLAYNVLQHSILRHSSKPISITPLVLSQLPIKRRGLTEFTYSRFLVPYLCGFKGKAVFMDADMVVTGDIAELFEHGGINAVSVMQQQAKFEWASVMLFNCGACLRLTPEFIDDEKNKLFDLEWAPYVGDLPPEWNHCVGYAEPAESKLYHFTQGLPCWYETRGLPEDQVWEQERKAMQHSVSWKDLMGRSVHAEPVLTRLYKRLTA